jgi:hypothetical protein
MSDDTQVTSVNDFLVAVVGKSSTGKSASLMGIENPEGVAYANCEAGKKLPFRSKFKEITITDPFQVIQLLQEVEEMPDIHTVAIDSLSFLLEMYVSLYVVTNTANGMKAWGEFAQFVKNMFQQHVAASTKNIIFISHTADKYNESELVSEVAMPVQGSTKNVGLEAYFSLVIATKKVKIKELEKYKNPMLTITEEDQILGYKHVYQTRLTKETSNERLRGPMGMWSIQETYIDNNIQHVINRLREYYA